MNIDTWGRSLAAAVGMCLAMSVGAGEPDPDGAAATGRILATAQVLADALDRLGGPGGDGAIRGRRLLAEARSAQAAGRAEDARRLATEAYELLRNGIRGVAAGRAGPPAAPPPEPAAGLPAGYQTRRDAALELRKAVVRVAAEKGRGGEGVAAFDQELASADAHAAAGRNSDAALALERAYGFIKGQLVALRSGDTLVRSLHFETPEHEFRYELDRNDTFAMLVGLLAPETRDDERVRAFLDRARGLRQEADAAGGRGDYPGGLQLLEESTREYQKVIRNAGILIPG